MEEEKTPGITCPKCGHKFTLGLRAMFYEITNAIDPESEYYHGYQEAIQYWFLRLFFVGFVFGALFGILIGRLLG